MTADWHPWMTAREFLTERRDFLEVAVVRAVDGGPGWDIVLRVDGTYSLRADAEDVAEFMRRDLVGPLCLRDVPRGRWQRWLGRRAAP